MMKYKSIAFLAILSFLSFETATAYVYFFTNEGAKQHWDPEDQPIPFSINQFGTEDISTFGNLENAIRQSFYAWDDTPLAEIAFSYQGPTSLSQRGQDEVNLVIFDSQPITYNGGLFTVSDQVGPSVVGITINTFYPTSGRVIDSDIIFNDLNYTFTVTEETDISRKMIKLQDVATHEIGHLIGLDHSFLDHATMWPYAKSGQSTLSEDDIAGTSNLYPAANFYTSTDSLGGRVTDAEGNPIWGIYVSAFKAETGERKVAAITDSQGRYMIMGLEQNTAYKLKACSVDLEHLGSYISQGADHSQYIPQYYSDVYRLEDAEALTTGFGSTDFDFNLEIATILARYDDNISGYWLITSPKTPISSNHYLAMRFPVNSLPEAFNVFGMTFWNNDLHMAWPRIMLTGGTDLQPDLDNVMRDVMDYVGKEAGFSTVEWETITLNNNRALWVIFQFPNLDTIGSGEGPGIWAENVEPYHHDLFYSTDNGATFLPYIDQKIDLLLYLTISPAEVTPAPIVQFEIKQLDFGLAKVGTQKIISVPISNTGTADLHLSAFESNKPSFFTISADNDLIPAGASDTLRVKFTPLTITTPITGTVSLSTDDPTRLWIDIAVSGQGAHPAAAVGATTLDFGEVQVGSSAQKSFTVRSTGPVSLLVSNFQPSSSHFSTAVDSIEIPEADSAAVNVTFAPLAGGAISGSLTFATDDSANPLFTIALSGTGLGGAPAKDCDFTGDGKSDLADVIAFMLVARANPDDPGLDWNGDGMYTVADVLGLLLDIKGGKCSFLAAALSSGPVKTDEEWRAGLTADDIAYAERMISRMNLEQDLELELKLALYGSGGTSPGLPKAYSLAQNHPNPFNPATTITYTVPETAAAGNVSIRVYDIRGGLVRVLVDEVKSAGRYTVFWDGTDQSGRGAGSGIYLYRMKAGGSVFTRKMVLLK